MPGLRIVWTPSIVVCALRERLRPLGLDTPALIALGVRGLGLERVPHRTRPVYLARCPACGRRRRRLWWSLVGFRCGACVDFAQHGPRCQGGRWPCRRHLVPRLERVAAEYLLACRLGAPGCAARRRRSLARRVAKVIPTVHTVLGAARLARIGVAASIPSPRPGRAPHRVGPIATALGMPIVDVLVGGIFSTQAYDRRIRAELGGRTAALTSTAGRVAS